MLAWIILSPFMLGGIVFILTLQLAENISLCFDGTAPAESEDEPR